MTKEEFTGLLDRYVRGECTPEEAAVFSRFVEKMAEQPPGWKLEDQERIRLEIYNKIMQRIPIPQSSGKAIRFPVWLRIAASVTVIFALSVYLISRNNQPSFVTVATKNGERDTVLLADGSLIYLNEASRVTFPDKFESNTRSVTLDGEAFFEVAKDKERPFTVYAGGFRTVALGTSFNIHALNDDSDIKVSLVTGKVEVSSLPDRKSQSSVMHILIPGRQLRYKVAEKQVIVEDFDPIFTLAWRTNRLSFENEYLDEVLTRLEKQYKVSIQFDKRTVRNCIVNGTFDKNESIYDILTILTFSNNLEFSKQNNKYIVTGQGCK